MNKKIMIGIGAAALVGIMGFAYASSFSRDGAVSDKKIDDLSAIKSVETGKDEMMKAGSYEAYSPEKIARAETGDVVLFFHASWCPSCRGLSSDIEKNLSAIPEGLSILKADYDKESELKKKYGITYQHTLVQVDKDGNLIKKWSGSPKFSDIISEIK